MLRYTGISLALGPLERVATLALVRGIRVATLAMAAALCACTATPPRATIELPAFDPHCPESCFAACSEQSTPITADPDSAVEAAIEEHGLRVGCDNRRLDCVACIIRAREAKAIQ